MIHAGYEGSDINIAEKIQIPRYVIFYLQQSLLSYPARIIKKHYYHCLHLHF